MIRTGQQYRDSIRDGRRVWINGEHVHVARQAEIVAHLKIASTRRNIERVIVLEFDQHRKTIGRCVSEVKAN